MHLDNHLAPDAFCSESVEDADHSHFDDVCLRALDRGIDGIALGKSSYSTILAVDVWQVATAVEEGFGIAFLSCYFLCLLHVSLNTREGAEVVFYDLLCLSVFDVHALGKTEGRDAVDDAEVGSFCLLALCICYFFDVFVPNLGSCSCMNIRAFTECFYHVWILAQVCHDA